MHFTKTRQFECGLAAAQHFKKKKNLICTDDCNYKKVIKISIRNRSQTNLAIMLVPWFMLVVLLASIRRGFNDDNTTVTVHRIKLIALLLYSVQMCTMSGREASKIKRQFQAL